MATEPGFHVDPAALRRLAGQLDDHAAQVRASSGRFVGPAQQVQDAFGCVGSAASVYDEYQRAVSNALEGLGKLQALLAGAADNLRVGALNYERADNPAGGRG